MGSKDYILRSVNVLNVLLLSAASLLVASGFSHLLEAGSFKNPHLKKGTVALQTDVKPSPVQNPAFSDYLIFSEQNIFHPERKVISESGEKDLPRPELVLFGTIITDGYVAAYIEDKHSPYSTPGRGKRQKVLKKGDSVSGFVLEEILKDRIILARGDEKLVVTISPGDKKRGIDPAPAPTGVQSAKSDAAHRSAGLKPAKPTVPAQPQGQKPREPARPGVKRLPFNRQ